MLLRIIKLMISTKLYEAIPLNIPFLATIEHGEVENIIRKYSPGSYILTEEKNYLDLANTILDAMEKYNSHQISANHVQEFLTEFSRENIAKKLMKIIEERIP